MGTRWLSIACGIALAAIAGSAQAIAIGITDTFSSGLENWFAGGLGPPGQVPPVPPQVIATGGPGGAGDAFMQLTAVGGNGPGSRLVGMNLSQWAGNYLAAGVGAIGMDVNNFGSTELVIRLLFEDPMGGPPQNEAVSSIGVTLAPGSGWTHVTFDLDDLVALEGAVAPLLSNTTLVRIIHATAAGDAEPVVGVLGVDNITALAGAIAVDEPATLWLAGLAALLGMTQRRR